MDYWHHRLAFSRGERGRRPHDARPSRGRSGRVPRHRKATRDGRRRVARRLVRRADERHVLVLLLADPDGHPIEIFHAPLVQFSRPSIPAGACTAGSRPAPVDSVTASSGSAMPKRTYTFYRLSACAAAWYTIPAPPPPPCSSSSCIATTAITRWRGGRLSRQAPQSPHARGRQSRRRGTRSRRRAQDGRPGAYPARPPLQRSHVLVLLPQPVRLHVRVQMRRAPATHQSEFYTEDFYGHGPGGRRLLAARRDDDTHRLDTAADADGTHGDRARASVALLR